MPVTRDWGTLADAAARLKVNPKTIRRMIARGDIYAERLGPRLIRVDLATLDTIGRPLHAGGDAE